ncbi:MAG TPA: polysaccharide biosynthesis tyrosine autokinase [Thermoanaerobaculia bacterium]|jgi:capsular exopolysaccharide synthesis family protein|nr:polysaccharide biosynthesis tyrosine autokinase [Thermoanaerobaculia bacterium]
MSTSLPLTVPDEPELLPREAELDFNLVEYLGWVRRWWRLVASTCLVTMAAGGIHYIVTPKTYRSTATIQIERHTLAKPLSSQGPWLENFLDADYYPTAYKQLGSRGLAERVVKRLGLLADPAFNRSGSGDPAGVAALAAALDDEDLLGALADRLRQGLTVEPVPRTQLVEVSYEHASPAFAKRVANGFADAFIDMGIEYRSASVGKTSTFLDSQVAALKKEIADKEGKLQALSRRTNTVAVDASANPALQRLQALNAAEIEATNTRLDKEAAYKGLLSAPPETIANTLQPGLISTMRGEELKLESEYAAKLKVYKAEWPAVAELKSEIERSKQSLTAAVKEAVATARKSAYAAYATALGQERQLAVEIDRLKSEVMDQSSLGAEFRTLGEEITTRRELLDKLLRTQSETGVEARLQDTRDSNVHILDRALTPARPFLPSLPKDLLYGLLLGLVLGVATAMVADLLDRAIKTPEQVEQQLGLPALAVIRDVEEVGAAYGTSPPPGYAYGYGQARVERRAAAQACNRGGVQHAAGAARARTGKEQAAVKAPVRIELVPHEHPRAQVSEAYRALRTALLLSSAHRLQVVAVTSAAMGEGKTATASNLAIVLAQLGRPVLIVDGDLRKPSLHRVFRASNQVGLVSHLTGTAEAGEIVHATGIPNLWITPAGPLAPAPSELLSSDGMHDWLRAVRTRFEYVVIDTPPMLAVTDALVVGVIVDGVVLALQSGKVTRDEARLCRDRLRQAEVRVLGAVLNRSRRKHARRAELYHSYETYVESQVHAEQATGVPRTGSAA